MLAEFLQLYNNASLDPIEKVQYVLDHSFPLLLRRCCPFVSARGQPPSVFAYPPQSQQFVRGVWCASHLVLSKAGHRNRRTLSGIVRHFIEMYEGGTTSSAHLIRIALASSSSILIFLKWLAIIQTPQAELGMDGDSLDQVRCEEFEIEMVLAKR